MMCMNLIWSEFEFGVWGLRVTFRGGCQLSWMLWKGNNEEGNLCFVVVSTTNMNGGFAVHLTPLPSGDY